MRGERDDLVLSEQERKALADLEAMVAASDPNFHQRLGGGRPRPPARGRLWPGVVLLVLGALTMLATFVISVWVAMVGVVMMAAGLGLLLPAVAVARRGQQAGS